jgi:hypothetical protein
VADGGRLAGAVGADEAEGLAGRDFKTQPEHALLFAEALGQPVQHDVRHVPPPP